MDKLLYIIAELDEDTQNICKEYEQLIYSNGLIGKQTKDLPYHIALCCYTLDKENELKELLEKIEKEKNITEIDITFSGFGLFGLNFLYLNPRMNMKLIELYDKIKNNSLYGNDDLAAHIALLIDEPENILSILPKLVEKFKTIDGKIKHISLYELFPKRFIKRIELNKK